MSYPNTPNDLATKSSTPSNTMNYTYYGMANLSGGLIQVAQINGVGLLTNGFVWQMPEIWFYPQEARSLTTGWTASLGYSGSATVIATGWTAALGYFGSTSSISTTWTSPVAFGLELPEF